MAARVFLATAILLAGWANWASGQTERPSIAVATTLPVEPATQAPFVIWVGPPHVVPRGSFLRVRGLPTTAALSEGHSIAPGAWAVPLAALSKLKIILPADAAGRSEIFITLVSIDGSVLVEARSTLVIAAARGSDMPIHGRTATLLAGGAPPLSPDVRERALRLVKKGDEQLAEGGIAQARLLYERAADLGLALGAMALAATYDAAELHRLGMIGVKPDREAAQRWYERARQLGGVEADARLGHLGAN